jgi:hypothetical protein
VRERRRFGDEQYLLPVHRRYVEAMLHLP